MKLSPPKTITWWIAFICFIIGILSALKIITVYAIAPYLFWIVVVGLGLLLLATLLPGL
jgi:hypothetical protein